jgi:uncharacterized protein
MTYRILSFCGGGIRGMLSAGLLARIAGTCPNIVKNADLMAGTSTGADIISALMSDIPINDVYNGFKKTTMFDNPGGTNTVPAYDIGNLVAAQQHLHGDRTLGEAKRSVLFTAFNVGRAYEPWRELLFHNLKESGTPNVKIVDAVVSSSAMPGMYGSYNGNIDGAFVNHDPTLAAIAVAIQNGEQLENISAICFGTGYMENWIGEDTSQWGAWQWQNANDALNQTPKLLINGSYAPVLNASLNGTSTDLIPNLCRKMLGNRYSYVNPKLDRIIPENATNKDLGPDGVGDITYMEQRVSEYSLSGVFEVLQAYWECETP